jgi:hypothetical protein
MLLEEAGIDPRAPWLLAEGADAAAMSRSIPVAKAMDDALLALYQNGERLRPENGYPVRLFLPGYEGNMSVKWLRRIKVTATPTMTKDETSRYTDLQADGKALMFTYPMEVKSAITRPSPGLRMQGAGLYELSGLAWSGAGTVSRVEISADGGRTWADAALSAPALPRALTRFRAAWKWNGAPAVLKSRATDSTGRDAAGARQAHRPARQQRHLPLQRDPGVERVGRRGGEECVRVGSSPCSRPPRWPAAPPPEAWKVRTWANPPRRRRSPPGTSASRPTAPACPRAVERQPWAPSSTRRSARPVMATRAPASPMTGSWAATGP